MDHIQPRILRVYASLHAKFFRVAEFAVDDTSGQVVLTVLDDRYRDRMEDIARGVRVRWDSPLYTPADGSDFLEALQRIYGRSVAYHFVDETHPYFDGFPIGD